MKELVIGALFIATLGFVLYFAFTLSGPGSLGALFGEEQVELDIIFEDVTGLKPNAEVMVAGIVQGSVESMKLQEDGSIRVTCSVSQSASIFNDASAELISNSVLGGRAIKIYPGSPEAERFNPDSGPLIGSYVPDFLTAAGRAMDKVNIVLDNAIDVTDDLKTIVADIRDGRGPAGAILRDEQLRANINLIVSNLSDTMASAKTTSRELERLSLALNSGDGVVSSLIHDRQLSKNVSETVANLSSASAEADLLIADLRRVARDIREGEGAASYLLNDPEGRRYLDRLLREASDTMVGIRGAAGEAELLINNVRTGKAGTVGKLFTEDALYNDLIRAVNTLQAGFEDIREAAPVTTFASTVFSVFQ